ncbi:ABC transporter permease [Phytohabitans sp. ZYX-F-186]|uniref:ABC transporter permease n=1 Tax=Phytohabitans maris TaxID=3071409 RepID=A0ABU0ZPN6_9ACTN|nr:ABC transporter permease subunit [Phytohabitans sp. ZYX-F-186]MDQ7908691.1 ABC transporter permease [Phytohabitans sp. ZYX-F-186]
MSEAAGVIHDIGYQRYAGPRLGRGYVFTSLYVHSLRTAFGLGRSAKAKIFPWFVLGVVFLTGVILAAVRTQVPDAGVTYTAFVDMMAWLVVFFVAVVAPELVSRDLRAGVLPLYFSRPLRRSDYPYAKLAALATAVWLLLGAPQIVMFLIAAFSVDNMSQFWTEVGDVGPGLFYAALWAAVFAGIGLLIASLTGKRAFAAGGIVAVFLMTTPVVGVLSVMPSQTMNELALLFSPSSLVFGVGVWLFGSPDGNDNIGPFGPLYLAVTIGLVAGCVALLQARYRKVASS